VEYGASKDLEKNRIKARNTPLGIILRSIFTLRRLRPRLRVTRRLRRRMHARIGIPLLLLPSRPHSERRRIGLPWAEYRYRQDFHTFSRQPWVLLRLARISHYRIRMRDQRFQVIRVRHHHKKVVQTPTILTDRPHTPIVQASFEYGDCFRWRIQSIGVSHEKFLDGSVCRASGLVQISLALIEGSPDTNPWLMGRRKYG
jgi:hypothetical protein